MKSKDQGRNLVAKAPILVTKHGQTPLSLSCEFIENMKNMPSGGPDGEALTKAMLATEQSRRIPMELFKGLKGQNPGGMGFDATSVPILSNTGLKYSLIFLHYITVQSRAIPDMINTMVGLFATKFFYEHPENSKISFEWVISQIGHGKIIGHTHLFPYFAASKLATGKSVFELMRPQDLYLYTPPKKEK